MPKFHSSPAHVVAFARQHRFAPTEGEAILWSHINACQLGVWFRRQVPIGRFIVDFLAPSIKLVVEVDGGYHAQRVAADARRDRKLARLGYRVVRVSDEIVRAQPGEAVAKVVAALE